MKIIVIINLLMTVLISSLLLAGIFMVRRISETHSSYVRATIIIVGDLIYRERNC